LALQIRPDSFPKKLAHQPGKKRKLANCLGEAAVTCLRFSKADGSKLHLQTLYQKRVLSPDTLQACPWLPGVAQPQSLLVFGEEPCRFPDQVMWIITNVALAQSSLSDRNKGTPSCPHGGPTGKRVLEALWASYAVATKKELACLQPGHGKRTSMWWALRISVALRVPVPATFSSRSTVKKSEAKPARNGEADVHGQVYHSET
jgi:hypothetical protein